MMNNEELIKLLQDALIQKIEDNGGKLSFGDVENAIHEFFAPAPTIPNYKLDFQHLTEQDKKERIMRLEFKIEEVNNENI